MAMDVLGRHRASGILLHLTCLPSAYGIGDMGSSARRFIDFLNRGGQRAWQILPLNPTSPFLGNSPYSSQSLFALNPILVSPERMASDGWLKLADLQSGSPAALGPVDYSAVDAYKFVLLQKAFERARDDLPHNEAFQRFRQFHDGRWLDDYALFNVIKNMHDGAAWDTWPSDLKNRETEALEQVRHEQADALLEVKFQQFIVCTQWEELRRYAAAKDVRIIGDLPFYPTFDSADVWASPGLFQLDKQSRPLVVAGVPPDYFSETGQRWGNPVYDWDTMKDNGFAWWLRRLERNLELTDMVRLDHFRAFAGYWVVPPHEDTAINGWWVDGPGDAFFNAVRNRFPTMPFIAEDLGLITDDVVRLRKDFALPGMRVLQFGFGMDGPESVNAFHNHSPNSVVYTGTHDNNTTLGWFMDDLDGKGRQTLNDYLGREVRAEDVAWTCIRLAQMSPARLSLIPLQDVLGLGSDARMNVPASPEGNWTWRVPPRLMSPRHADRLRRLCALYARA